MHPSTSSEHPDFLTWSRDARRSGYVFVPTEDKWRLSRDIVVRLGWSSATLSKHFEDALRATLAHFAEHSSAGHVQLLADDFKHFTKGLAKCKGRVTSIAVADVINYRSILGEQHLNRLYRVSRILRFWNDARLVNVDPELVDLLRHWRLKGGIKGSAVRTRDPHTGPLTDLEFQALIAALYRALGEKRIRFDAFVLTMVFCATGRRPCQLRDLKVKDFVTTSGSDGAYIYVLRVPRAKLQNSDDDVWRSEFKDIVLDPELGAMLTTHVQNVLRRTKKIFDSATCDVLNNVPMFPNWIVLKDTLNASTFSVNELIRYDYTHRKAITISLSVSYCIDKLKVMSERLGAPMHIFPYRLRRTLATRAAREGCGDLVIAELLDHTDTQNVRIYTENVSDTVNPINVAVALRLAPLAQAFAGVLVDGDASARRGNDPTSLIKTSDGVGTGTCGKYGFCGALAPIACYTCKFFQPWLDGPHEQILEGLVHENNRIKRLTRDGVVATVNDRTLLAVAEVIRLCSVRRAELQDG